MKKLPGLIGLVSRPKASRTAHSSRRSVPRAEPLEGRKLLALLDSIAFTPSGQEVVDVVYGNGALYQFDSSGSHYLGGNVKSAGLAYDHDGNQVQDIVFTNGLAYQYDSTGVHYLGNNVESIAPYYNALDKTSAETMMVVFTNHQLYKYDAGGSHFLGNNVICATATTAGLDTDTEDITFTSGTCYQYSPTSTTPTVAGQGAVSVCYTNSIKYGTFAEIVYTNGSEYEVDSLGPHDNGTIF